MKIFLLASTAMLSSFSAAALAQDVTPGSTLPESGTAQGSGDAQASLADIVVTAQRRAEKLQDVPISINVSTGEQLAQRGIETTFQLPALAPGLQVTTTGVGPTIYLRGVGSDAGNPNNEPSVATYIDGVYIANPYALGVTYNGVERIEVLKGPQGTLFGRNATGGVIQIITRDPGKEPTLEMSAGYANYNTISGSLYASAPLSGTLSANLAVAGSKQNDGWGTNVATGKDAFRREDISVRGKLLWTPTSDLTVNLSGDYASVRGNYVDYRLPKGTLNLDGQVAPADPYDTRTNLIERGLAVPYSRIQQFGGSLHVQYDAPFGSLMSITAYRKSFGPFNTDADATPIEFQTALLPTLQHNFSQELQFNSPGSWPVKLTAGAFYYNNTAGYKLATISGILFGATPGAFGQFTLSGLQHTRSLSAYAQATYEVLPNTKLTGGIRFTHERSSAAQTAFGFPVPKQSNVGYDKPTWRLALDHLVAPDIHLYASYNRGVKGGGFDVLTPGSSGFAPEQLDTYEAGFKTEFLDNRVRFNAAYFYNKFKNIQVSVIKGDTGGLAGTTNAASARIQGFDADFALAPVKGFTINGGVAYLDGKYIDFTNAIAFTASPLTPRPGFCLPANPQPVGTSCTFDASGNKTIRTPRFTGNLSATYEVETDVGAFDFTAGTNYSSRYYFDAGNRVAQSGFAIVNLSLGWNSTDKRYGLNFFIRNLTDKYFYSAVIPSAFGDLTNPGAPRTFGGTLRVKIGG